LVIPTRGPTAIAGTGALAGRGSMRTGPSSSEVAFRSRPMASACVSLPGPEHRSSSRATPRAARMISRPSAGSSARISTAAPTPPASQTALSIAWIPYER
jgi:hypothetical protein